MARVLLWYDMEAHTEGMASNNKPENNLSNTRLKFTQAKAEFQLLLNDLHC